MQIQKIFVMNVLRYAVLVAIIVVSGYLLYNSSGNNNEDCQADSICNKCSKVKSCSLPAAKEYRKNKNKTKTKTDTLSVEVKHQ